MKIAVINISDRIGGSGIAAYRIAASLKKDLHQEVFFLVRTKSVNDPNIYPTVSGFLSKVERLFNSGMNLLGLQYVWLPFSPKYIYKKLLQEKPDVIWLNNSLGGYFATGDLVKISKLAPIVWTMHDMWPFIASAAHTFGDESWKNMKASSGEKKTYPTIGINTSNWLIKRKKEIYQKSNIRFVSPSQWLYQLALQSPVLKGKEQRYIQHGIDLNTFKPSDKAAAKKHFNIPANAKVLMFSAQKLSGNFFKGGNELIEILQYINEKTSQEIHILLLGEDKMSQLNAFKNLIIHNPGYLNTEAAIIAAYNAADIFLYPTKADNLPLVLIEAIACGTPCITFDIGGCSDMIKDEFNGYLLDKNNISQAGAKTLTLLNDNELRQQFSLNARKYAEEKFDVIEVAKKYEVLLKK